MVRCEEPFEVRFRDHLQRKIAVTRSNLSRPGLTPRTEEKLREDLRRYEDLLKGVRKPPPAPSTERILKKCGKCGKFQVNVEPRKDYEDRMLCEPCLWKVGRSAQAPEGGILAKAASIFRRGH